MNAGACRTVRTSVAEPVPLLFVALRVILLAPPASGIPLISPDALTLSPAGNGLAPKDVGLFEAVI